MNDTSSSSSSNEQKDPQGRNDFDTHAQGWQLATSPEWLEEQIAHRAQEISSRNGVDPRRSLATWLEAAKEILAKVFEKPN